MNGRSGLTRADWLAVGGALVLVLSMFGLEWFAYAVEGQTVPGSGGDPFRWLDGPDQLILACAILALAALLLRLVRPDGAAEREVAFVTGAAGLVAAVLVASTIISPPDLDPAGVGALSGTDAIIRAGAVVGLLAALAIIAGSTLTLVGSQRPVRLLRSEHVLPAPGTRTEEPAVADAAPAREARPMPKPAATTRRRAAPKRKASPKPKGTPKPRSSAPKPTAPPAKLSIATASVDEFVAIGFTVTQAQRIVAYRDEEAIVNKVADLKRVPGIAKPVLAELIKQLDD